MLKNTGYSSKNTSVEDSNSESFSLFSSYNSAYISLPVGMDTVYWENQKSGEKYSYFDSNLSTKNKSFTKLRLIEVKSRELISVIKKDSFIEGEISDTQAYIEKLYIDHNDIFSKVFNKAWLAIFSQPKPLATFVGNISNLKYELLGSTGDAFIMACYSNKDLVVKEAVIRVFESWENPKHVEIMENMEPFAIKWLEDYRQSVISYLKSI